MAQFGATSKSRLLTCHVDIQTVMNTAIIDTPIDFTIVCGFRNQEDQDKAYAQGYSRLKWPNGKHNKMPSRAVDIAPIVNGDVIWNDNVLFEKLSKHVLKCAEAVNVNLTWGGAWVDFPDRPHYQLEGVANG